MRLFSLLLLSAAWLITARAESLSFQLPEKLHAVPGIETNIYFDNLVLVPNPDNYIFDVEADIGRHEQRRWTFTPETGDVGSHEVKIRVSDGEKLLAEGVIQVEVVPADAGHDREITLLIVGDSHTARAVYPLHLRHRLAAEGNPRVKMIGTNGPEWTPGKDGVSFEGYGGWRWETYLSKTAPDNPDKPHPNDVASPFLKVSDGGAELDFQGYLNRVNDGKAPDFIMIMLGCNDIFGAVDATLEARVKSIVDGDAARLLGEFRRVAPQAQIGLALVIPPAASQDPFGLNYGSGQSRWQYKRNAHRLNAALLSRFGGDAVPGISLIPVNLNLDCVNNYPFYTAPVNQGNPVEIRRQYDSVHPAPEGYHQIGDTIFAWLKSRL